MFLALPLPLHCALQLFVYCCYNQRQLRKVSILLTLST
jgi:hypothetical protein